MIDKEEIIIKIKKYNFDLGRWVFAIVMAIVSALLGFLVAGVNGAIAMGVYGFLLTFVTYVTFVPFAGIFLYWILGNQLGDWLIQIAGIQSPHIGMVKFIPLIIYGILGAVVWAFMTFLGFIFLIFFLSAIKELIKRK